MPTSSASIGGINSSEGCNINRLPLMTTVKPSERLELFARKLHACCTSCNFFNEDADIKAKELKYLYLKEIVEYMDAQQGVLNHEPIYALSTIMLAKNIFRDFPPKDPNYDPDEDDAIMDPAWPHLELVYEYFLHFLAADEFQPNIAKKYLDSRFVTRLLYTFASEDFREREVLKTVLHRIYGKFLGLRATIRRHINYVFLAYLYDGLEFSGTAEILEILGSVINGYTCPLKPEHISFLNKVLIPLHASKDFALFQPQLVYCIVQYMEKDSSTTTTIIKGIFKYWPRTCSAKAVLVLGELEELIDVMQPVEFNNVQEMILNHLSKCITSDHFQVVERALYFWDNEYIMSLIEVNAKQLLPLILPSISRIANYHWNPSISSLGQTVLRSIEESTPDVYEDILGPSKTIHVKKGKTMWKKALKLTMIGH